MSLATQDAAVIARLAEIHPNMLAQSDRLEVIDLVRTGRAGLIDLIANKAVNTWTSLNTPTIATGKSDPFGGTAAVDVGDDTAATDEGKFLSISFTGNGTHVVSTYLRKNTASATVVGVRDTSIAGTNRGQFIVTWNADGTVSEYHEQTSLGCASSLINLYRDGWYRLLFQVKNIVAANANPFFLFGAATGNTPVGITRYYKPCAWNDATIPTSEG